jgi:predicted metal-dependent enzyme (double-stranded beta helix superfamily)
MSCRDTVTVSRRRVLAMAAALSSQLIVPLPLSVLAKPSRPLGEGRMDIDRFVEGCIIASRESEPQAAVLEVLARAVHTPKVVLAAIGQPKKAGLDVLHRSATLTIFSAAWTPQMNLMPHNHLMWANIGIYTGREDNIMWRRTANDIEAFEVKTLFEGDSAALPDDAIHSVTNPLQRFTGGIHIYGGDFFKTTRTQWNPETLAEEPSDGAVIRGIFERENERMNRSEAL